MVDAPLPNENPSSRDLTWARGLGAPDELSRLADALDAKAMGTFATASLIIGVVAALSINLDAGLIFFTAFAFFVLTAGLCLDILVVRTFKGPDDPRTLRQYYWEPEPEKARDHLWAYTEAAFDINRKLLEGKGKALRIAIPSLFMEVVLLLIWLLTTPS